MWTLEYACMRESETDSQPNVEEPTPIEVRMLVSPPEESDCKPADCEPASVKQTFHLGSGGSQPCHMALERDGTVTYSRFDACESCPCFVVQSQDCIADLLEIRDGRLLYSVTFPDRAGLPPLVESLREAGATVTVTRILSAGEEEDEPPTLTEKQHETIQMAIRAGYYDRPRRATLDDIADELGITTSAASQRLNSVKRRLIDTYLKQFEAGQVC
jgi:hypothetical protein